MRRKIIYLVIFINSSSLYAPPLKSSGSECFLNTAIQLFYKLKPFNDYLENLKKNYTIDEEKGKILLRYLREIEAMQNADAAKGQHDLAPFRAFLTNEANQTLKKLATGQQDAHEMIIGFLQLFYDKANGLKYEDFLKEKDSEASIPKDTASTIHDNIFSLFEGYYKWTKTCATCKTTTVSNLESFGDLRLNVSFPDNKFNPNATFTLEQLIKNYFEQINDVKMKCDICKKDGKIDNQTHTRTPKFSGNPKILLLVLRRFLAHDSSKLLNQISFPMTLDMQPYMSKDDTRPLKYNLIGILIHSGAKTGNASSGHYYGYYKDHNGDWFYCNDTTYDKVKVATIELIAYDAKNSRLSENATPYILVYERFDDQIKQLQQSFETVVSRLGDLKTSFGAIK